MKRAAHLGALFAIFWGGFFLHSCVAGPRFADPLEVETVASAPRIQVGIEDRVESATFRVAGEWAVHGEKGPIDRGGAMGAPAAVRWDGGIRVGDRVYAEVQVRIVPARDGDLEIGKARYHGDLIIVRDEDRNSGAPRVTLVNEVDLETYLRGVVGKEMSLDKPEEALKAQVIAARTYAMYEMKARTLRTVKGEKFDVYDDERSQVYGGMERETARASALVDATRGMFVAWEGRIIKTFFAATCGGHTEPAHLMLGREADNIPPLSGVPCGNGRVVFCENAKYYRWSATLSKPEVAKKLFGDERVRIAKVEVTKTMKGGHAMEVELALEGTSRKVKLHANDGFRRKIDPRAIRSTLWERIEEDAQKIVLHGRGWGHACGMCQTGAYRMAELGHSAVKILEHYYPTAKVEKLY
jgi:stage II sporulation protein D